jgi:hypothetical protein
VSASSMRKSLCGEPSAVVSTQGWVERLVSS